jgi:hypothetical protein
VAAVARASSHRGVKDDEVVAHYARAREASPGVIQIDQPDGVVAAATTCILRTQYDLTACDEHSKAAARAWQISPFAESDSAPRCGRAFAQATRAARITAAERL